MFTWEFRFTTKSGRVTDWYPIVACSFEDAKAGAEYKIAHSIGLTGIDAIR
jgi:hypothetical protein